MAIPSDKKFESFLQGCLVTHTPKDDSFVAIGDELAGAADGELRRPQYLAYQPTELPLAGVLKHVVNSLRSAGCVVDDRVAVSALAMAISSRPVDAPAVTHVNQFLAQLHSAKLIQHVVMPGVPRPDYELVLGSFCIRPFAAEKILYWASRCGSAYPIDLRKLNGQASLECDPLDVRLLECQRANYLCAGDDGWALIQDLIDGYYAAVSRAYANRISDEVRRELLVPQSAAFVWVDVEALLNQMFVQVVSLFTWKDGSRVAGWATYTSQSVLNANFTPPEILSASRRWLSTELGFTSLSDDKLLDQTIRTFCKFLHSAHSHRLSGRRDEAFLQFVIGLDLLLGTKGRSSESVAKHAAVLVHRQFGQSIEAATRTVKSLYDVRSQYVHAGTAVSDAELAAAEKIATEILWTLLATSGRGVYKDVNEWLKTLGFIFSAMSANRMVEEIEFESIGVPKVGHRRCPPNRVLSTGRIPGKATS